MKNKHKMRYFLNDRNDLLVVYDNPEMFGVNDIMEVIREDESLHNIKYKEISKDEYFLRTQHSPRK